MLHCIVYQLLLHQRSLHIMVNILWKQRGCQTTTPRKGTPSPSRADTFCHTLFAMRAWFCLRKTLLGTAYKQTQAPISSLLSLAHICIKTHFPFCLLDLGSCCMGQGRARKYRPGVVTTFLAVTVVSSPSSVWYCFIFSNTGSSVG